MKVLRCPVKASVILFVTFVVWMSSLGLAGSTSQVVLKQRVLETLGQLGPRFEPNRGQTNGPVKFLARGNGYTLFLSPTEAVLAFRGPESEEEVALRKTEEERGSESENSRRAMLRMKFLGANPSSKTRGLDQLSGVSHYFFGKDSNKWLRNIPHFAKVQYTNIYPGISVIFYANQRRLEYDFVVSPGADPKRIRLAFEGAEQFRLGTSGSLKLQTTSGEIVLEKPVIYQESEGVRRQVSGGYKVEENRVSFQIATSYDSSLPLVIDPVLSYSSYLGGSGFDEGKGIAVDAQGQACVTGETRSVDFPTQAEFQESFMGGVNDVFVTKVNAAGDALVYSTYLGGSGDEIGYAIAVDSAGNAYITGQTNSGDTDTVPFPTTEGAFQVSGDIDAFVTKLDSGGSIVYSTYLGANQPDVGRAIAVDSLGNAYVAGEARGVFPTTSGAFQTVVAGSEDAFATKLNAAGSDLVYSTFLGGSVSGDGAHGVAVDSSGNAWVTGETSSSDFPLQNALQSTYGGGLEDGFVTKLTADGTGLLFSTFLGGKFFDRCLAIGVDKAGNTYVTGEVTSDDFPVKDAVQPARNGGRDAFATKFDLSGNLVYSTFLGGGIQPHHQSPV